MPLRLRLFAVSLVLAAMSVVTTHALLVSSVEGNAMATLRNDALARARLASRVVAMTAESVDDEAPWNSRAEALAVAAQCRVTVIRRDGRILGDSAAASTDREDAASSAEVTEALGSGSGWAARTSVASTAHFVYAAASFERPDGLSGVVRLALPAVDPERAVADARRLAWLVGAAVLALALLLTHRVAGSVSRVAATLIRAATRMREGDLTVRTRLPGHDDLAELGLALDRLAAGLETTFGDLRSEGDLQRRILEAMHDGVVVVDRDGRIALVNPALRSMLLLGTDAVGKLLIETVRHAQLHTMLADARARPGERPAEIELPGLKPRRMLVQVAPLGGDGGLMFVFVDVTELRRLESLRRDFVANASHELRTPIAAVRSATETLRTGALEDRLAASRFVDIIERNAVRLQSLVEDMLELSKLESNEFKLKRERVELQRVVPIVLALFRERADKKGVRLTADLPAALPPIEGDPRALEHVLSNLVDNAVKYCPAGTRILVGAAEDETRVRLVVSDTGPGIASEHLSRVFERFYRVDAGRSREIGGTGLGLSIVKHMVEAMRGKVSVESTVGGGSTFSVLLPKYDFSGLPPRESGTMRLT
jgi:two-component system phosphate regulon sensor histidine kinase PhoR